jgi:hypothetical protein
LDLPIQRADGLNFSNPVDALVAIAKRLNSYEERRHLESEEFYDKFCKGLLQDERDFIEWSNAYQHYLALKSEIDKLLRHAA